MLNQFWALLGSLLLGTFAVTGFVAPEPIESSNDPETRAGFAVVELFTSQGCSSCPPADRVLAKLAQQNDAPGQQQAVYLLSFHVDYWNDLGWEDPYSLPESTARQKAYARAWSSRRVYTPQMVVNGTHEFNGGNERKARLAIDEGLQRSAQSQLRLEVSVDGSTATVECHVDGDVDDHLLNVALVSESAANAVPVGENGGKKLVHVNVVRAFKVAPLRGAAGSVSLEIPDNFDQNAGLVVAYVQRREDAVLTAAAAQSLK